MPLFIAHLGMPSFQVAWLANGLARAVGCAWRSTSSLVGVLWKLAADRSQGRWQGLHKNRFNACPLRLHFCCFLLPLGTLATKLHSHILSSTRSAFLVVLLMVWRMGQAKRARLWQQGRTCSTLDQDCAVTFVCALCVLYAALGQLQPTASACFEQAATCRNSRFYSGPFTIQRC